MERIALFVHPFYCNIIAKEMVSVYEKAMEEYDNVFILSPSIHPNLVSGLLLKYKKELIEYYITNIDTEIDVAGISTNISTVFRRDWFEWLVKEMLAVYRMMLVESDEFIEFYSKFISNADTIRKDMDDYLYMLIIKTYMHTLNDNILKDDRCFTLFTGDLIPRHHKDLIYLLNNRFRWTTDVLVNKPSTIEIFELGPIPFVIPSLKGMFKDYNKDGIIIDVFGEYLNQCVNDVSDELNRLGYRNNVIANKSIYYSEDDIVCEPAYANVLSNIDSYDIEKLEETFKVIKTESNSFILIKK